MIKDLFAAEPIILGGGLSGEQKAAFFPLGSFKVIPGNTMRMALSQEVMRNTTIARACITYVQDHFTEATSCCQKPSRQNPRRP